MTASAASILSWIVLIALLVVIAIVDLRSQRIPNALNGALLVSGLIASAAMDDPGLVASGSGVALGGATLLLTAIAFHRLRGMEGLGLGDVKFLAAAGAWVGWQGIGPTIFIAAATALLSFLCQRVAGRPFDRHAPIAFGPYLCLALGFVRVAQVLGPNLLD